MDLIRHDRLRTKFYSIFTSALETTVSNALGMHNIAVSRYERYLLYREKEKSLSKRKITTTAHANWIYLSFLSLFLSLSFFSFLQSSVCQRDCRRLLGKELERLIEKYCRLKMSRIAPKRIPLTSMRIERHAGFMAYERSVYAP